MEKNLGAGAGATNEMLIQTPRDEAGSSSVLTPDALLAHLDVLKAAAGVVVERDDVAWKLKDLCYAQTIPLSEVQMVDQVKTTAMLPLNVGGQGLEEDFWAA